MCRSEFYGSGYRKLAKMPLEKKTKTEEVWVQLPRLSASQFINADLLAIESREHRESALVSGFVRCLFHIGRKITRKTIRVRQQRYIFSCTRLNFGSGGDQLHSVTVQRAG